MFSSELAYKVMIITESKMVYNFHALRLALSWLKENITKQKVWEKS